MATRRQFLAKAGLTVAGGGMVWFTAGCQADPVLGRRLLPSPDPSPLLIVVQLLGGNDALNTVVPLDGRYHDARPTLGLTDDLLVPLPGRDDLALPAELSPLLPLWNRGDVSVALGTGFTGQTRSHFQSLDTWWQAGLGPTRSGWLGRWAEASRETAANAGMDVAPVLRELVLGAGAPILNGSGAPVIGDPRAVVFDPPADLSPTDFGTYLAEVGTPVDDESPMLGAARAALPAAVEVAGVIERAGETTAGGGTTAGRSSRSTLTSLLDTVATLVAGQPGLRTVSVGIGGFDTHAGQSSDHPRLLADLAEGLAGLWNRLSEADRRRTLIMTTSEFGRRVVENGSAGTDHGRAGLQFFIGGRLGDQRVIGEYGLGSLDQGDLPVVVDAVDTHAEAVRWLAGSSESVVEQVFGSDPPPTGLLGS